MLVPVPIVKYGSFAEFFKMATGNCPYEYQEKLATKDSMPDILNLPTGAGKTEAAVLSIYIWRRLCRRADEAGAAPRRLIYCLPMRTLVEQTAGRIKSWIKDLGLEERFQVVTLMGGNAERDWRLHPEQEFIIVGTQDMLLSRALNRGYVMNIFQWPVEFGLLNSDSMWVVDEVQLMGNGLATTAQLQALRDSMATYGPTKTVWMSATVDPSWLDTPDSDRKMAADPEISAAAGRDPVLRRRSNAHKLLKRLDLDWHDASYNAKSARAILDKHDGKAVTLVIVNTVGRAQSLFRELREISPRSNIMLVHSRFRSADRTRLNDRISNVAGNENLVVVSTQAIEAGVDMSARTLITELAPWPSLVQRLGRCNRRGKDEGACAYVIDVPDDSSAPYGGEDLKTARARLEPLYGTEVTPATPEFRQVDEMTHDVVLRRRDLLGLFDTAPDLTGSHTDVSQFVRSSDPDTDVGVLWRRWDGKEPPGGRERPGEVCRVPLGAIKKIVKGKTAWRYDYIEKGWRPAGGVYPGATLLLRSSYGGYDPETGFDVDAAGEVEPVGDDGRTGGGAPDDDSHDGDLHSTASGCVTLNDHTQHVMKEVGEIAGRVGMPSDMRGLLATAAKYHDMGKAHHVFQETMLKADRCRMRGDEIWAKSPVNARHSRRNFRHEAIGAVAFRKLGLGIDQEDADLVSYLIMAHHGKVRMSMRTLPRRKGIADVNSDGEYVLGLPAGAPEVVEVFTKRTFTPQCASNEPRIKEDEGIPLSVQVDASMSRIGSGQHDKSWPAVALGQLERWGPFRLAYLEALMRAADARASAMERG